MFLVHTPTKFLVHTPGMKCSWCTPQAMFLVHTPTKFLVHTPGMRVAGLKEHQAWQLH